MRTAQRAFCLCIVSEANARERSSKYRESWRALASTRFVEWAAGHTPIQFVTCVLGYSNENWGNCCVFLSVQCHTCYIM